MVMKKLKFTGSDIMDCLYGAIYVYNVQNYKLEFAVSLCSNIFGNLNDLGFPLKMGITNSSNSLMLLYIG